MAKNRPIRRIQSSAAPDFSGLMALKAGLTKKQDEIRALQECTDDVAHAGMIESAQSAIAQLLVTTNIAAFINRRCEENGIDFQYDESEQDKGDFYICEDGTARQQADFPLGHYKLVAIKRVLNEIGIPKSAIREEKSTNEKEQGRKYDVVTPYIEITSEVIDGLIDKAVADAMGPILKKLEKAAKGAAPALKKASAMIARATGEDVIDERPEAQLYSTQMLVGIGRDIKRKLIAEMLGKNKERSANEGRELC